MNTAEYNPTLSDIVGDITPADIFGNLIPAPFGKLGFTKKYFVDGLPEVVVRHTQGEPEYPELVAATFNQLSAYGIDTLPYVPVEYDGEIYVVTRKVHGESLENLISPDIDPALVESIDQHWANMVTYFRSGREQGFMCAADILGLSQHMYGRTSVDAADKVQLVDLGESAVRYKGADFGQYERILAVASNDVVEIENTSGRLSLSRRSLESALTSVEQDKQDKRGIVFARVARFVLTQGVAFDIYDDQLLDEFAQQ